MCSISLLWAEQIPVSARQTGYNLNQAPSILINYQGYYRNSGLQNRQLFISNGLMIITGY